MSTAATALHTGKAARLGDVLSEGAARWPERTAVHFPQAERTYAELLEDARTVARALYALGVRRGDHVGILMPNCVELVTAFYGTALLGAVVTPVNARYKATELRYVVENADLAALVITDISDEHIDYYQLLTQAFPDLPDQHDAARLDISGAPALRSVIMLGSRVEPGLMSRSAFEALAETATIDQVEAEGEPVSPDDVGLMVYTSGTTANPKGCQLTHRGVVWVAREGGQRFTVHEGDVFWDPLPMFHMSAILPMNFTLDVGGTFVSMSHFEPETAIEQMRKTEPSLIYPCFPPITMPLITHPGWQGLDLDRVRVWLNVAPLETLRLMHKALPHAAQIGSYGITEGGGIVSYNDAHEALRELEFTVGPPLPSSEVRIVGPNGEDLPPGERGEILVRGVGLMKGYYKDPERTAQVIDDQGWLHTGDLCSVDAENRIAYFGRIKDMMKVGGENVAPAEIESFLSKHPAVELVQVIGVPDERLTEVPCAYIQLRDGEDAVPADFIDYCRDQIASYKVPRHVRIIAEWPMSATKIQRYKLREMFDAEAGTR
ncbi:MAG: class I adenylate-forming enzyme family protein [Nostocoides sp.]